VIRHEKVFDEKVKGRIALTEAIGYTVGPIFLLTKSPINTVLESVVQKHSPLYELTTDLEGLNDLHGIHSRVFRVAESTSEYKELQSLVGQNPLYIADGHHRYHAALKNNQTHVLSYIVEKASIQAYNRVITGKQKFADIVAQLALEPSAEFQTPKKHEFAIYHQGKSYVLKAKVHRSTMGLLIHLFADY
jgi:uncharacterized protein (DUF1015 family)